MQILNVVCSLPNFVQTGVTLVKRIPDVFLMGSFFIFVFLEKKISGMKGSLMF